MDTDTIKKYEGLEIQISDDEGDNMSLELRRESGWDVVEIYLNGINIGGGDWSCNIKLLFEEALKLWKDVI